MGEDKAKDKEQHNGETTASSKTLAKTIAEVVAREMAKAHVHYQAILNERGTATIQSNLKVSSGANGFKVMDPFNWTKDKFPNQQAEERAIRDAIFLGMNSQWARDKAINLMNEEGKELTVEFLMNQLAIEDCYAQHKSLSQLNSSSSMNFAAYDCRQNKGKSNKSK